MSDKTFYLIPEAITQRQWTVRDRDPMQSQNAVRIFRSGPDQVTLQIRGANRIMSASLPFDVALGIATQLRREAQ